jgi:hypothetical protein
MRGLRKGHLFRVAVVFISGVFALGCRAPRANSVDIVGVEADGKPLPASIRVTLGTIGLISSARTGSLSYAAPSRPAEAGEVISERTFEFLHRREDEEWSAFDTDTSTFGEEMGDLMRSILVSLVAGVAGGLVAGTDAQTLQKAERSIHQAMAKSALAESIGRDIAQMAEPQAGSRLVRLSGQQLAGFSKTNYQALSAQGIETALEIVVFTTRLRPGDGFNPSMRLEASVHVHLTRAADGVTLYSAAFDYGGSSRKFVDWAAENGKLLRTEIQDCSRQFAHRIVEHLFTPENE